MGKTEHKLVNGYYVETCPKCFNPKKSGSVCSCQAVEDLPLKYQERYALLLDLTIAQDWSKLARMCQALLDERRTK